MVGVEDFGSSPIGLRGEMGSRVLCFYDYYGTYLDFMEVSCKLESLCKA